MTWNDSWVAFDTETTGLDGRARIVEVAAVVFEGGVPVHEWSQLLCPEDVDWDNADVRKALEINRIDRKDLQGRPTFSQVLPDLLMEFSHDVWVAHNASFDMRMIGQELQRLNRPALSPKMLICTLELARHFGGATNKLNEVAARFRIAMEDAHRAAVDARTCGLILNAMLLEGRVPREDVAMAELTKKAAARRRW